MATSAQDKVHAAHRRLRCKSSDAISALNALLAFEACSSERTQAFCDASFLHIGNLREAAALHRQLHRVLSMPAARIAAGGAAPTLLNTIREGLAKAALRPAMQRPSDAQALVLRRCLAAGWPDQVARRMRSQSHLAAQSASGKRRAVRYQACSQQEDVYVHPRSALQRAAPDFLLFQGLAASEKRTYISGATAVDPAWLPDVGGALATLSPPLREPPPAYQPRRDQVLAWHSVTYGVHSWDLPLHAAPLQDATERAGHFAAALLSGHVLPAFEALQSAYTCKPHLAATREGRALQRVSDLVATLAQHSVDSRTALLSAWRRDGRFLQAELAALLPPAKRHKLAAVLASASAHDCDAAASSAVQPGKKRKRKHPHG